MRMLKLSVVAVAATAIAVPASAVVTTFASFSALNGSDANLRFVNSGNANTRTSDAQIYTTSSKTATTPGAALVKFSFLQTAFTTQPAVQNITARFTLSAFVAKNAEFTTAVFGGSTFFDQLGISGSFSFVTTSAITVTGPNFTPHTYAAGSNLLSATFSGADVGDLIGGTSGSADASTLDHDTINFTSDFLDFSPTLTREIGLSLLGVDPSFARATGANKALKTFRAVVGGQFSSDSAPVVNGLAATVPEPSAWTLMVAGFGLVGVSIRRRVGAVVA